MTKPPPPQKKKTHLQHCLWNRGLSVTIGKRKVRKYPPREEMLRILFLQHQYVKEHLGSVGVCLSKSYAEQGLNEGDIFC